MELRRTLANGVEVITDTNPHLHSFCATVRIRAGSAYEQTGEQGITHLMEHCVVRGLKGRFAEDYYVLQSRGGVHFDARTGDDHTEYEISGSPRGIPLAAEIIRKMFLPIRLSAGEYRVEKDRVLAELAMNPYSGAERYIDNVLWGKSPLKRRPIGLASVVKRTSRNRLNAYLQSILAPGNVRMCLTGCISGEELALLLEAAEAIPMYDGPAAPAALPMPEKFGSRDELVRCHTDFDYLRFVFDVDPRQCSRAAVGLVREILFSGDDALLYREISEKTGLVYSYRWPFLEYRTGGMTEFGFRYELDRLVPSILAAKKAMQRVMDGDFDLDSKKSAIRARWERMLDDPVRLNAEILRNLELTDSPTPPDWEAVTKEEVMACANTVFRGGAVVVIYHRAEVDVMEKAMAPLFTPGIQ